MPFSKYVIKKLAPFLIKVFTFSMNGSMFLRYSLISPIYRQGIWIKLPYLMPLPINQQTDLKTYIVTLILKSCLLVSECYITESSCVFETVRVYLSIDHMPDTRLKNKL